MLRSAIRKAYRLAQTGLGLGASLAATGCATPSLNLTPGAPTGPSVVQVEDHITCILATQLENHIGPKADQSSDDYKLWRHLVDDNFLATINLTLFVTKSEGFNPSLNYIEPLTNLGGHIAKTVESSNGITSPTNVTANTYNLTLAMGVQLTGLQDRNFVQTYIVDMHRLYDDRYDKTDKDGKVIRVGALGACKRPQNGPTGGVPYSMKGDLALDETLNTGLLALDKMPYTPVTAGSAPTSKSSQTAATASVSQSSGASSFSSKIDFSLTWGANGGPNWTLLDFKGPAGGGSGASSQLLNYSRQKQDTLIATFAATCKSDDYVHLDAMADYFPAERDFIQSNTDFTSVQLIVYKRRRPYDPHDQSVPKDSAALEKLDATQRAKYATERYVITIAIPFDKSGLPFRNSSTGTGAMDVTLYDAPPPTIRDAAITWSTFYSSDGSYSLRGSITDAQSGTFVGYLYVGLNINATKGTLGVDATQGTVGLNDNFRISSNGLDAIRAEDKPFPPNYWASLASCTNAGPFLPSGLNVLQQLPGGVSSALQQQR